MAKRISAITMPLKVLVPVEPSPGTLCISLRRAPVSGAVSRERPPKVAPPTPAGRLLRGPPTRMRRSEWRLVDLAVPLSSCGGPTIGRPGSHDARAGNLSAVSPATFTAHRVKRLSGDDSVQRSDSPQKRSWVHDGLLSSERRPYQSPMPDFQVLLRHRLLPQPGGFEGLSPGRANAPPDALSRPAIDSHARPCPRTEAGCPRRGHEHKKLRTRNLRGRALRRPRSCSPGRR